MSSRHKWTAMFIVAVFVYGNSCICTINNGKVYAQQAGSSFYISMTGDDSNMGTIDAPFKTLEKARDTVRLLRSSGRVPEGGVTIYIRQGNYKLKNSFALTEEDSGTEASPVTYTAYNGEVVNFIGGETLDPAKFRTVTDGSVLKRIPVEARGKVKQIDLKAQGITDYGTIEQYGFGKSGVPATPELFFNKKEMTVARWPNQGFVKVGKVVDPGSIPHNSWDEVMGTADYIKPSMNTPRGAVFGYDTDRPSRWVNAKDAWLYGYWLYDWADESMKIESVNPDSKTIKTVQPHLFGVQAGKRYYAFNLMEEIDIPGEWYLNRSAGILYFYPPQDLRGSTIELSMIKDPLFTLKDTSYINLKGLTMEAVRGNAVSLNGGSANTITACTIRNTGLKAITIDGGNKNGVVDCDICDTGTGGISVTGGDGVKLIHCDNYVTNNDIYRFSRRIKTYTPAVVFSGVGITVSHNRMHDSSHSAMVFSALESTIEYNEIYNVLTETDDAGAIYVGRDFTKRGNVIRYNYLHDISGSRGANRTYGVYLDDFYSGMKIYGNIFCRVSNPVVINGGRDNIIQNNIIVNKVPNSVNPFSVFYNGPGSGFPQDMNGAYKSLVQYSYSDQIKQKYPEIQTITADNANLPMSNVITGNLIVNHKIQSVDKRVYDYSTIKDNLEIKEDPGFVDMEGQNWNLNNDSAVFEKLKGFQPVPFDDMGLYKDEFRTQLPSEKMSQEFSLVAPKNKAENMAPDRLQLTWSASILSDKYRLMVSDDPEFKNVVYDVLVNATFKNLIGLESEKRYYWKVAAVQSMSGKEVWNSNGIFSFNTSNLRVDDSIKVTNITELLSDKNGWDEGQNALMFSENSLKIASKGVGVSSYKARKLKKDELLHFSAKFSSSQWTGFGLRCENLIDPAWKPNNQYLLIIKPDGLEMQRFNPGQYYLLKTENKDIRLGDNQWHDIVIGVYNIEDGANILFMVDGKTVLNVRDTGTFIEDAGYFSIYDVEGENKNGYVEIAPPQSDDIKIPKSTDFSEDLQAKLGNSIVMFEGSTKVYVNNESKLIDQKDSKEIPIKINGRVFVPLRFLTQSLGGSIAWDAATNIATVTLGKKEVNMQLGSKTITVNGALQDIEAPAQIIGGRVYLPLRAIAQALGQSIFWDERGLIVISPSENLFDSKNDAEMIDNLCNLFNTD